MRCFMPLKEAKAYHWAMRTALRHFVTDTILSFDQYIACDKELAIYQPLRAMMENVPCVNKSRNRLDTYHVLKHRWATQVIVTVSSKEGSTILKNVLSMLSSSIDYPESEDKMRMCIQHYQQYYNSVKEELKSDNSCKYIEEVAMSIEINMEFLCHYNFIDVTTLYLVGDSIVEGSNSGLKRVNVTVSTDMNIDTLSLNQV